MLLIFNLPGIGMVIAGALVAIGGGHLLGIYAEPPLMVVLGLIVGAMDVAYRLHRGSAVVARRASLVTRAQAMGLDWIRPAAGGSFFFVPVWGLGVFWLVLGALRLARGY